MWFSPARRRRVFLWWPLLVWAALMVLGCGGALQAQEDTSQPLLTAARQQVDAGQFDQAKATADGILASQPKNEKALYLRGLAQVKLGDYQAGKADLEAALAIDPLHLFAANDAEWNETWKLARDKTAAASGEQTVATPTLGDPPAGLTEPVASGAADPAVASDDPLVQLLLGDGPLVEDRTAEKVLEPAQLEALRATADGLANRRITLKLLVLPAGTEPVAEARRLHEAARLSDTTLVIVGTPVPAIGAYNPLLDPALVAGEIEQVNAQTEASFAGRMLQLASALGKQIQAPPEVPPTPPGEDDAAVAPEPVTEPTVAPVPAPVEPARRGLPPLPALAAISGIVLGALLIVWRFISGLLALRRLRRGFSAASPQMEVLADRLTAVARAIEERPVRAAITELDGAELAWFEAVRMMGAAEEDDTGDIGRVERAVRLLDEVGARLDQAEAALADGQPPARIELHRCYFTGRPVFDRYDGELVLLTRGDESRQVLAHRSLSPVFRRGQVPRVRCVDVNGQPVHWSQAEDFEAAYDLYHPHRLPPVMCELTELTEPFVPDPDSVLFVDFGDRPDYTVPLDGDQR